MDFIVGEKFYNIADFIYSTDNVEYNNEDYNKLQNTFDINSLNQLNIVYLHTMYKEQFFNIIRNLDKKFIIITHNSDLNIDTVDNLPSNVIKWFSQNVNVFDERLESIPIGLENSRWFKDLYKKEKIINKHKEIKSIKNLLYINHNINTNRTERLEPYLLLKNKDWCHIESGSNGQNFDNYINNLYNHKFVLCPNGNGIDTHRLWETLYLNTIPIVKNGINVSFYKDLPICFVDNWNQITEDFLNNEFVRIKSSIWNLDKLKMEFWKNKIINEKTFYYNNSTYK